MAVVVEGQNQADILQGIALQICQSTWVLHSTYAWTTPQLAVCKQSTVKERTAGSASVQCVHTTQSSADHSLYS